MKEDKNNFTAQAEETENKDSLSAEDSEKIIIPVKFNKDIIELTVDEASVLAQKGMKYDFIKENYDKLKNLSERYGKGVSAFLDDVIALLKENKRQSLIEKCGGNEELAEHILNLEEEREIEADKGFSEIREFFPEFATPDDLPHEVTEAADLKGTHLLDELLRYKLYEKKRSDEAIESQKRNQSVSIGSQVNRKIADNPETVEFLKGLWK